MRKDVIRVVEAAYNLDDDADGWLRRIFEALLPLIDRGSGVGAYFSDEQNRFTPIADHGLHEGWHEDMGALMSSPTGRELMRPSRPAISASDNFGEGVWGNDPAVTPWRKRGLVDGVGLTATDGSPRVLTIFAADTSMVSLAPQQAEQLERLAGHIAAGWRLRAHVGERLSAVLSPSGKVLHAEGRARHAGVREAMRTAAVKMDRARGPLRRRDAEEALDMWKVLVDGEWSLVEQFDRDGRRFIVACRNATHHPKDPRALTSRERQILTLTALGHSGKLIGYELGLSPSVVTRMRKAAMNKLGLRSRADLVRLLSP